MRTIILMLLTLLIAMPSRASNRMLIANGAYEVYFSPHIGIPSCSYG